MSTSRGLRVRQHERWDIKLTAEFVVSDDHGAQVKFSSSASVISESVIQGETIDISPGGLAFASRQFLPLRCEGIVRVFSPTPVATKGDGKPILQVLFERQARVQRIRTLDHQPSYKIGLSFAELDLEIEMKIAEIQDSIAHRFPAAKTAKGENHA
ncbi:MAG: PilZ domain-containing protein [Planctomycetes bacterium]|nr:PilZ domain-containing protein [Planctomycetota bacterium]